MNAPKQESVGMVTNVVATLCDCTTREARVMAAGIAALGRVRWKWALRWRAKLIAAYHARFAVARFEDANIVPTAGLAAIAAAWAGQAASIAEIEVNKSMLGTGNSTPVAGDTVLDTEVYRKNIASQSVASNVAYNTAFYTAAEVSGTFYEHGLAINGTASADTGTLAARVLLNAPTGITKSLTQTLTIEHQHTFVFNP